MAHFFTSDEHYGHENVIKFCNRPFANMDEMTEALIANHNAKVSKGDITYHLGDMFWRKFSLSDAINVMDRLNGQHPYIWGNHDELIEKNPSLRSRFVWLKDLVQLKGAPKIVLCHYAMRVWRGSHRGTWHLYGHSHGTLPPADALSHDVGVDCNNYAPLSLEEVGQIMKKKQPQTALGQIVPNRTIVAPTWPTKTEEPERGPTAFGRLAS